MAKSWGCLVCIVLTFLAHGSLCWTSLQWFLRHILDRTKGNFKKVIIKPKSTHIQKALRSAEGRDERGVLISCLGLSELGKSVFFLFRILKPSLW